MYSFAFLSEHNVGKEIFTNIVSNVSISTTSGGLDGVGFTVLNSSPWSLSDYLNVELPFSVNIHNIPSTSIKIGYHSFFIMHPIAGYMQFMFNNWFDLSYQRISGKLVNSDTYIIRCEWNQSSSNTAFNPSNPIYAREYTLYRNQNYFDFITNNTQNNSIIWSLCGALYIQKELTISSNQKYRITCLMPTYTLSSTNTPISLHTLEMSSNDSTARYITGWKPDLSNPNHISEIMYYNYINTTINIWVHFYMENDYVVFYVFSDYTVDQYLDISVVFDLYYYDDTDTERIDSGNFYCVLSPEEQNSDNSIYYTAYTIGSNGLNNINITQWTITPNPSIQGVSYNLTY